MPAMPDPSLRFAYSWGSKKPRRYWALRLWQRQRQRRWLLKTLEDLRLWAASAPAGTTIPAASLAASLAELTDVPEPKPAPSAPVTPWRVLLWTVDSSVRLGRDELLEGVGRPASWLYRHTGPKATDRIPHRRVDGALVFLAGEVRAWLMAHEEVIEAGPMDGPRLRRAS